MSIAQKQTATQSQKLMIFVLSMSLYGLATLFTELIPKFQVGVVEFSVEYFLFIPLTLAMLFDPLSAALGAATGELVAPDGNGTTQGTVKLDFISGKWTYSTTIAHTIDGNGCSFKDVTCDSSIGAAAKLLLQALAMLPDAALTGDGIDATYGGDYFYINNAEAERCLVRGGGWNDGGGAGVFDSNLSNPRSNASGYVGGRSAFYE